MSKNVQEVIQYLTYRKRSVSCGGKNGLLLMLEELGFSYRNSMAGHYVFYHKKLTNNFQHSINCGHNISKELKIPYVVQTINMLKKYQNELGEENEE